MMRSLKKSALVLALLGVAAASNGCSHIASLFGLSGTYSFTGASIPDAAQTFSVAYISNNTAEFATLGNALTEGLRDRFTRQTRLGQVPENGDLAFEGEITMVTDEPSAIGAATGEGGVEGAVTNRVTVTVQIMFTNAIQPELSFRDRQTFTHYVDYDTGARPGADGALVEELVETLVDNIFNAAVAQW